jgi:beta-lactam-binding protein with PASTA domain
LTVLPGACVATTVPNVVGLSQTAAAAALRNAHLVVGHLNSHCGDADTPGMVMGQVPAASNDPVQSYSAVSLIVSQGRCYSGECPAP